MDENRKRYLTSKEVCARYGGKSPSWLNRRKKDPAFPKPLRTAGTGAPDLYDQDELNAYDAQLRERAA